MSANTRMLRSLEALALGDAWGERGFSGSYTGEWKWTDDTAMALGIVEVLTRKGHVDQDELARVFVRNYMAEPDRGYGRGQHRLMREITDGADWRTAARELFHGGSFGNGGAMRVAPLGAYFADDIDKVVEQAALATEVTHAHREGIAGAVAVAVAACLLSLDTDAPRSLLMERVRDLTPEGDVRAGIEYALTIDLDYSVDTAVSALGNGSRITAQDTVPLCIWLAAKHRYDYADAMRETVRAGGDRDTNCAIVGGILGARKDCVLPADWLKNREPLPA
ncbi:MAG: ADP-ribosylglycohydrolase family protein [Planctomycetes bacterium]|nr:ADP-ribosylglycohydrolase family protein [Planctomycetota bacterium]